MSRTTMLAMVAVMAIAGSAYGYGVLSEVYSTGVYDENISQARTVTVEHASNTKSLTQFSADIAAAYLADLGGVCNFDDVESYQNGATELPGYDNCTSGRGGNYLWEVNEGLPETPQFHLGISQSNDIDFDVNDDMEIWPNNCYSVSNPISGPTYRYDGTLWANGASLACQNDWRDEYPNTIGGIYFTAGNGIVELAVTVCEQPAARTVDCWVVTDSGPSAVKSFADPGGNNIFFHFVAPAGETIQEIWWQSTEARPAIDDLALITVPEPATMSLLALGGLALLRKRR